MGSGLSGGSIKKNEWITVNNAKKIGPEIGRGHVLSQWLRGCNCEDDYDILILKSCIGKVLVGIFCLQVHPHMNIKIYKESPN